MSDAPLTTATEVAPTTVSTETTTQPAAQTAEVSKNWYDGFAELDVGFVQNKGWKTPQDLLTSYQALEKKFGVPGERLLAVPEKADDAEGWAKVYDKLGRPESADKYELAVPDGMPRDFANAAAGKFHELGLTASQGKMLADWYNAQNEAAVAQYNEGLELRKTTEMADLKKEWGSNYDQLLTTAKGALAKFPELGEHLNELELVIGPKKTMNLALKLGQALGEHGTAENTNAATAITPAQAKAKIHEVMTSPDLSAKYLSGDVDLREKMAFWHRIAG